MKKIILRQKLILIWFILTACGQLGSLPPPSPIASLFPTNSKNDNSNYNVATPIPSITHMPLPVSTDLGTSSYPTTSGDKINQTNSIPTMDQTPSPISNNINIVLYVQDKLNTGTYFYTYPKINNNQGFLNPDQIIASPGPNSPGPSNLSIANFENRVAYVDLQNDVWIADLMNRNPVQIHSFPVDNIHGIYLTWTPDDKHIIIDATISRHESMIYHLENNKLEEWNYICDRLALSPHTQNLSIWCTSTNQKNLYAVLEWGGEIWYSDQPPRGEFMVSSSPDFKEDFRFRLFSLYRNVGWSSDGHHIAFFNPKDSTGTLTIVDQFGKIEQKIPQKAYWLSNFYKKETELPGTPIQWSKTGDRLLILAIGNTDNPCPTIEISAGSLQGSYPNPGCWQVIDSRTGNQTWNSANVENGQIIYREFEAAISPDGRNVAFFTYMNGFNPQSYIIDIDTQTILQTAPYTIERIRWGPKN